jgi:Na+-driven multidrug efflux pump
MKIFLGVIVVILFFLKSYFNEHTEIFGKHPFWCLFFGYWAIAGILLWLVARNKTRIETMQNSKNI